MSERLSRSVWGENQCGSVGSAGTSGQTATLLSRDTESRYTDTKISLVERRWGDAVVAVGVVVVLWHR
jgi:hypothetical protein